MKKTIIIIIATILFALTSKSQILLENNYSTPPFSIQCGLTLIKLDLSGEKYFFFDIQNKIIKLYNLNHSLFKTINIPNLPTYRSSNTSSLVSVAYLSENLFNSNSSIEYVAFDGHYFVFNSAFDYGSMRVYDETGAIIFNGDSLMPCLKSDATYNGYEGNGDFIFNTPAGTKMILFSYKNNTPSQRVYSLPGQLVSSIQKNNESYNNALPFPNPTNNSITLPYKLESGKDGKLVINDINGKILFEYKIDTTFDNVLIDTNTMTAGNYFYSIYTSDKKISTGKFIVTK